MTADKMLSLRIRNVYRNRNLLHFVEQSNLDHFTPYSSLRGKSLKNGRSSKKDKMSKLVGSLTNLVQSTIKTATPQLRIIQRYAAVELVPPTPKDIPAIRAGIGKLIHSAKTGAYKNLTVKEAWLNTLVAIEVYCWFFIGECIGKRHIVGYDV